jgi:hypothetical protein
MAVDFINEKEAELETKQKSAVCKNKTHWVSIMNS